MKSMACWAIVVVSLMGVNLAAAPLAAGQPPPPPVPSPAPDPPAPAPPPAADPSGQQPPGADPSSPGPSQPVPPPAADPSGRQLPGADPPTPDPGAPAPPPPAADPSAPEPPGADPPAPDPPQPDPTPAPVPGPPPDPLPPDPREVEDALELTRDERRLIQLGLAAGGGFDPGPSDGLFGNATRSAIEAWQAANGREPTGFLDAQSASELLRIGRVQARADATRADLEERTEELGEVVDERDEVRGQLEEREDQLDETQEQAAADRARYGLWIAGAFSAAAVVGLLIWVVGRLSVKRARRQQVKAETLAQAAQSEVAERDARDRLAGAVPAVFLDGADADGRPVALSIPGSAIASGEGAVVGRNPFESTVVLDHNEVSRRHFRLFARGASIAIEDLNSTNGTVVNGVVLEPGDSAPLPAGAALELGGLALTVTLRT